jgi:D-alanyl-D-alanine dipeptidase
LLNQTTKALIAELKAPGELQTGKRHFKNEDARMARAIWLCIGITVGILFGLEVKAAPPSKRVPLPAGFVFLRDVDSTIVQDIRYATSFNFTGAPVSGYNAPECVLLREAANALKQVQDDLRLRNLALKVYDCYRPKSAVRAFVKWVKSSNSTGVQRFFPRTPRADLLKLGYIATSSGHSLGTAVDLTLIPLPRAPAMPLQSAASYGPCNASKAEREPDESVDMGTSFDCFDLDSRNPALIDPPASRLETEVTPKDAAQDPPAKDEVSPKDAKDEWIAKPTSPKLEIGDEQRKLRLALFEVMTAHNFKGISPEWWHYSYVHKGRRLKPQDFAIPEVAR